MKNISSIKKYIFNTNWLLIEKFFSMGMSFLVSVYVIRYLGPEQSGLLDYSLTITQLLVPILGMGLSGILVRELVKKTECSAVLLSSGFFLKLTLSVLLYFGLFLYAILVLKDSPEQSLVIILGLNLLLNSFLVLEHYYIAIVQGKKNAISKIVAISISSGIKITLIHFEAELIYFVITLVVETTFYSALLVTLYLSKRPTLVKPDVSQMKSFIKNGWPFILSDYSMFLLKKVDILMVKYFLGFAAVGYYSVAVKISVLLAILPMVVLTSIFPYLVKSDSEAALEKSMVKLYRLFVIGMVLVCIGVAALSEDIVYFLFGTEFSESATLLTIYAWSGLFMTIHMINNKWFIIKNLQKEFFYRALISGLVNVVLSYIAIQEFGLPGAASGTLISMVILSYVSLYFSANGRKLLHIFHSSFFVRNKNVQNIL